MGKASRTEVSRRGFLVGATAALGLGGVGLLTGCGSGQTAQQSGAATAQGDAKAASTTSSWMPEKPKVADSDIKKTVECDVLVVGCGTAGWAASLSAAEAGADVMVVERGEKGTRPKEDIGAIDSKLQKELIAKDPKFAINKIQAMHDIGIHAANFVDFGLIKLWMDESGAMVDWISEKVLADGEMKLNVEGGIGVHDETSVGRAYATGHSPQSNFPDNKEITWLSQFEKYAEKVGVKFSYQTELTYLEQDKDGRVTGIIGKGPEGYVRFKARKGTVLATGGYSCNTEMMKEFQPWILDMKADVAVGSLDSGEGIIEGMRIGAAKDPIGTSILFNRCCVKPDQTAGYENHGEFFWFGEQPFLKVNLNGERFCDESGPYDYMLHAMYMQPKHTYVDIWDANFREHVRAMEEVGCCRLYPFDNGAPSNRDIEKTAADNEKLVEKGYIQKADTIEELAQKLNIPAENLKKTVDRYNEMAAKGVDEDFGKEKHRLHALNTAPFYGVRTCAWHLATFDGLRINTNMQVLKADGTPIEGLYAAGDCSGGFFSVSYPNLFTGLACGRSMTFGRHVGKYLAAK